MPTMSEELLQRKLRLQAWLQAKQEEQKQYVTLSNQLYQEIDRLVRENKMLTDEKRQLSMNENTKLTGWIDEFFDGAESKYAIELRELQSELEYLQKVNLSLKTTIANFQSLD